MSSRGFVRLFFRRRMNDSFLLSLSSWSLFSSSAMSSSSSFSKFPAQMATGIRHRRSLHHLFNSSSLNNRVGRDEETIRELFGVTVQFRHAVHVSPFPDVVIPETDLYSHVFASLDSSVDRTCVVNYSTGVQWTLKQMRENSARLGSALVKRGLAAGDVVAIFSPNSIEFVATMMATVGVGAILTPANYASNAMELRRQLELSAAKFLVTTADLHPVANEAVDAPPALTQTRLVVTERRVDGVDFFDDLLDDPGDAFPSAEERRAAFDPSTHPAMLPFSSGTTALPKGVELTHRNLVANICQGISSPEIFAPSTDFPRERPLAVLPMWHVYQSFLTLLNLKNENMSVILPKFEPDAFLRSISEYKLDFLPIAPPLVIFLNKHPKVLDYDLSSVRDIISGAAPLSKEVQLVSSKKFPQAVVRQAWGMSELSPMATCDLASNPKPGSCGVVVANTQIKILDLETQKNELNEGEVGEIIIKGPQVMKGYWNNPEETKAIFKGEWMHTGDIGKVDADQRVWIVDRLKELIKYKGHQVAPADLEGVLLTHPSIADAGVIGVPDEIAGEIPRAFVQLKPDAKETPEDIQRFVDEKVNPHSKLRGGVVIVDVIPKSSSGKILRKDLREK